MKSIDATLEMFTQSLIPAISSPGSLKELLDCLHLIQQNRTMSLVQKTLHLKEIIKKQADLLCAATCPLREPFPSFIYAFHTYLLYHHTPDPKHHLKLTLLHYSKKVTTNRHLPLTLQNAITQITADLYQQPSAFTIIESTQAATSRPLLPPVPAAQHPPAVAQLAGRKRHQPRQSMGHCHKKNTTANTARLNLF